MTINYVALKNEIQTDPTSRGYAPYVTAGNDAAIANLLNMVVTGNRVNTMKMTSDQLVNCIVHTEYTSLSAANRAWVDFITGPNTVDLNNAVIKNGLLAMFAAGTTRTNIIAAQQRDGSRAETLFGVGTFISDQDVAIALRG